MTAAAAVTLAGCSSTTAGTVVTTRTVTHTTAPPAAAPQAARSYGTGTYVVGTDIPPGTYQSDSYSGVCVFQRLANLTGAPTAVIDQAVSADGRPITEQILPSDKAVTIGGDCQFHWVR